MHPIGSPYHKDEEVPSTVGCNPETSEMPLEKEVGDDGDGHGIGTMCIGNHQ